jgi:hypothetical protein
MVQVVQEEVVGAEAEPMVVLKGDLEDLVFPQALPDRPMGITDPTENSRLPVPTECLLCLSYTHSLSSK